MWLNHFVEFERKQKRDNRLVLGFYNTDGKAVKVFLRKNILIPSSFMHKDSGQLEKILGKIEADSSLAGFSKELRCAKNCSNIEYKNRLATKVGIRDYHVLRIEMPHNPVLEKKLPRTFQTGNYDLLNRLSGFFPERKVSFDAEFERAFFIISDYQDGEMADVKEIEKILKKFDSGNSIVFDEKRKIYEVELASTNGIAFSEEFPSAEELRKFSQVYLDIEKPLWKSHEEKEKISLLEKKEKELGRMKRIKEKKRGENYKSELFNLELEIAELQDELTLKVRGLEDIHLYEPRFDSAISWIVSVWKNPCHTEKKEIRELWVLDASKEFNRRKFEGYNVKRFNNEKELVGGFLSAMRERKPLLAFGHNEVYDFTQLRFAANEHGESFDSILDGIEPRRDYVREFLQRLREDMVYIDTLSLAKTMAPFLGQRSFGTSFKLEPSAKHFGVDFEKSRRHEDLRWLEIDRIWNDFSEMRKWAGETLAHYTVSDIKPVEELIEKTRFIEMLCEIKKAMPYATMTEIGFSPRSARKMHTARHFSRSGNLPYFGYNTKEREDELQIFKKRFLQLKQDMLKWASVNIERKKKEHENVSEIYLPLEEWLGGFIFRIAPEMQRVYEAVKSDSQQRIGICQYMKSFASDVLADYYFARKERKEFEKTKKLVYGDSDEYGREVVAVRSLIPKGEWNAFVSSFRTLKNLFRSVYVNLDNEQRSVLRPKKFDTESLGLEGFIEDESDLFLLMENIGELKSEKSAYFNENLKRFATTFGTFYDYWDSISAVLKERVSKSDELPYIRMREERTVKFENAFSGRYGFSVEELKEAISRAYLRFAENVKKAEVKVIDRKGDYLFITPAVEIPETIEVRRFDKYETGKKSEEVE